MNIGKLMQLKGELDGFKSRHPKFPLFLKAVQQRALTEGTLMEIKVTTPDGQTLTSNLRLTQEDLDVISTLFS